MEEKESTSALCPHLKTLLCGLFLKWRRGTGLKEERQRTVQGRFGRCPGPSWSHRRSPGKGSLGLGEHSLSVVTKGRHPQCRVTWVPVPACTVSMNLCAGKGPPLFPQALF